MDPEGQALVNMKTDGLENFVLTFSKGNLYLQAEVPETSLTKTRKPDNIQLFKTKPIQIKPVHYILFIKIFEYANIAHSIAMQSQATPNLADLSPDQKRQFVKQLPPDKRKEAAAAFEEMLGYIEELEDG